MAEVKSIIKKIENFAPLDTVEAWDNSGWQINLGIKETKKILTALDVTEQTVDEAIPNIDSFIDACLLASINEISIIHGRGTGALRKGIHDHLKKHKSVAEFRLGAYGEGDRGVTIVKLK